MANLTEHSIQSAPSEQSAAPPSRGPKVIALAVLLGVLAAGVIFYLRGAGIESTDDAFLEGHVIQISPRVAGHILKVYVNDNQPVKAGELLVELDPRDYEAKLAEARADLAVSEGKRDAAAINVNLTSETSQAGLTEAHSGVELARSAMQEMEAAQAVARSAVRQADAEQSAAEAAVSQAKADVLAAQAEHTRARNDLARYQDLITRKAVSQQQLDQATATEKTAAARLDVARQQTLAAEAKVKAAQAGRQAAEEGLKQAQSQIKQAQARIGEAGGRLASAKTAPGQVAASRSQYQSLLAEVELQQAKVRQAELNLSYTKIVAPESGLVTRKAAEPGAFVQVGQALLAVVPRDLWVVANFKETQLTHMRPGQPVAIEVDAFPDLELHGRVDSLQSGTGARFSLLPAENATGNFVKVVQRVPVKIVFDQAALGSLPLAPGMSVVPKVQVNRPAFLARAAAAPGPAR